MDVADTIRELLYFHDAVTVPGFGTFLTEYQPAHIHPVQHVFQPPSKRILFNRNLQANDGLLANALAESENSSTESALQRIRLFVKNIEAGLMNKEGFEIKFIGKFQYDIEKNLQFVPDHASNFLTSSIGLVDFVSPPIIRREETAAQEPETKIVEVKKRRWIFWG